MHDGLDRMLSKLVLRCWRLRTSAQPYALHDFIEFCTGQGNLTLACLMSRMHGVALDRQYHPDHNTITRIGLRIWIDCISQTKPGAMTWWGTQCSSFVVMCKVHHKRSADNGFWGDCKHRFVREGNIMQLVTALTMMLAHFCGNTPILEQPTTSVLPRLEPLHPVLNGIGAKKTIVWHGSYTGGTSPKPLQLWGPPVLSALVRPRPKHLKSDSLVRRGQSRTSSKKYFTGTKALKGSETYSMDLGWLKLELPKHMRHWVCLCMWHASLTSLRGDACLYSTIESWGMAVASPKSVFLYVCMLGTHGSGYGNDHPQFVSL